MLCVPRGRLLGHQQHRVQTIIHMQVGFSLCPVAQDAEIIRMISELPVKVEDVPMAVTLAKDGDQAENVTFKPETFAISLD